MLDSRDVVPTELHRDDFTVSRQTMPARGIAVVGPSIEVDLDVQVVRKGWAAGPRGGVGQCPA
ncbi:hypothetical protein [Streptomyces massasporeus]|uniref:hypothetical protein n=1 Tax=Streptomyces massasporeus TaxID=67324 RepID=UPI00364FD1FC